MPLNNVDEHFIPASCHEVFQEIVPTTVYIKLFTFDDLQDRAASGTRQECQVDLNTVLFGKLSDKLINLGIAFVTM